MKISVRGICIIFSLFLNAQPSSASISDVRIVQETSAPAIDKGLFKLICKAEGTVNSRLWLKDSRFLSTSSRLIFSKNNETVSFSPVLQSDEASYQCAASDTNSSVTSAKYRLNIKYGPQQVSITGPDCVAVGQLVTFTCSALCHPVCEYKWYLNGREKAMGESYIIGQARPVDGGRYTCVASNKMTSQTRDVIKNLSVIEQSETPASELSSSQMSIIVTVVLGILVVSALVLTYHGYKRKWKRKRNSQKNRANPVVSGTNTSFTKINEDSGHFTSKNYPTARNPAWNKTKDATQWKLLYEHKLVKNIMIFIEPISNSF
ncbi:carcinoembryonic antigen-related cell adhesion molecule 5-like [Erpetoichthys calabaricus]|uniref:carcinoembryonic antigen-related cell adhesion molecule 5-like n=1 Tax=Erpetoichthys calabaricus TaxID=27687 RepID=UPI002234E007|nr:carcinoembryonic antigen-related cell adhesion molecule 5-like [Erpetoichthys calabaricus]